MRKPVVGILCGVVAGGIDLIPMLIQKLPWDANLSAFSMWVVAGYLISVTEIRVHSVVKGIVVALSVALPCMIIIGSKEPFTLIPILIMTLILGALSGFTISKINKKAKLQNSPLG